MAIDAWLSLPKSERNSSGFDPSIRRHSGISGVADEALLNNVNYIKKKNSKKTLNFRSEGVRTSTLNISAYHMLLSYLSVGTNFKGRTGAEISVT